MVFRLLRNNGDLNTALHSKEKKSLEKVLCKAHLGSTVDTASRRDVWSAKMQVRAAAVTRRLRERQLRQQLASSQWISIRFIR
jgi:hypothetical protein